MGAACASLGCCESDKIVPQSIEGSQKIVGQETLVVQHDLKEKIDDVYHFSHGKDAVLSSGSTGSVTKAQHKKNKTVHAIKSVNKSFFQGDKWKAEVRQLKEVDHAHICKIYEIWEDMKHVYLVLELCQGGDLSHLHQSHAKNLNEGSIAILMRQMTSAVAHLHEHSVHHGDIRLENWFFAAPVKQNSVVLDMDLKMIDFGLSLKHSEKNGEKGKVSMKDQRSAICKAPEQLGNKGETAKSDVWALGVIAYFLLSGSPPFPNRCSMDVISQGKFDFLPDDLWRPVSSEAKEFIRQCMTKDVEARPEATAVLNSPWMGLAKHAFDEEYQRRKTDGMMGKTSSNKGKLSILDAPLPSAKSLVASFKHMNQLNALERVAITAVAHNLPASKIEHLRTSFEQMDRNGDGVLQPQELHDGLKSSGIANAELMEVLRTIDTDGSGAISYTEFIASTYEFQRSLQDSTVWSVFRIFDADHSGKLTKKELLEALGCETHKNSISEKFPETSLESLIENLDKDGDGEIDFDEFKTLLSKH
mmetsp:Transcript_65849/g.140887  ORF Transcript_65849/g.140887 Transcript_65849/m.140887 type:complete len:531 (-) Transcript_65849:4-1596(-)